MTHKMINDAQKTRVFVAPEGKKGQKLCFCYGSIVKYTLVINNRFIMGCNWRQVGSCLRLMDDKRRKNKNNNATVPELGV